MRGEGRIRGGVDGMEQMRRVESRHDKSLKRMEKVLCFLFDFVMVPGLRKSLWSFFKSNKKVFLSVLTNLESFCHLNYFSDTPPPLTFLFACDYKCSDMMAVM